MELKIEQIENINVEQINKDQEENNQKDEYVTIQIDAPIKQGAKTIRKEQLYTTISKLQPKNLMLVEFLALMIEKSLVKNSHKIQAFADMFAEIKGKKLDQDHSSFAMMNNKLQNPSNYSQTPTNQNISSATNSQPAEKEEQKFNKKKFLKLLKDVAKLLYPGDPKAFETTLFTRIMSTEQEQNRMKLDDNIKKFLVEDVLDTLSVYNREMEALFEIFMPENYNSKLGFSWNEIRLLEKKLPMMCVLRILFEAEICPQLISPMQYLEIISKTIPPQNTNHKEVMFYYSQTFNNYMREYIFSDEIKLLQGDIGFTFLQFSMVLVRIATQAWKDTKQDVSKAIDKLFTQLGISDIIRTKRQLNKMSKVQSSILKHIKDNQKATQNSSIVAKSSMKKKTYFKKENQQLMNLIEESENQNHFRIKKVPERQIPLKKLQNQSILITKDDLFRIKKNLDDELQPVPQKQIVDKQNDGYFNVNEKFTVIGEQLPKLQDKNKPAAKPNPKDKAQDPLLGFKPEQEPKQDIMSNSALMFNRKKKLRVNTEYPIFLSQIFYPNSFADQNAINLKQDQQIYIETTYIHLGERLYEEAYANFQKAQRLIKAKKTGSSNFDKRTAMMTDFYMEILQAQIFQSAGKDQAALLHYHNAKQISLNFPTSQHNAKAFSYMGLGSTLYHLQEYEFALRCLLKAKQIYGEGLQIQSITNAVLMNNIGGCYMMLNRNQEAVKYLNLSHQILDLKVGRFDQRTLVAQQNISKNKKAFIDRMPAFKTMWKTYVTKSSAMLSTKNVKKPAKK